MEISSHSGLIEGKEDSTYPKYVGDILVLLGEPPQKISSRTLDARWDPIASYGNWNIFGQLTSSSWRGFPITNSSCGPWHYWLVGELYGHSHTSDAVHNILERFFAQDFLSTTLNGHFLLFTYNTRKYEWHIWTDRFGTIHGYQTTHGNRTAIGTFSPAVANVASPRKLDWIGLSGFFSFGYFPDDRTFFEGVKILRPATHYVWNQNGALIQESRYWNWSHAIDRRRSFEETVQEFGGIFQQVMGESIRGGRIGIPISGGLDSRSTVAALSQSDAANSNRDQFWGYSYGYFPESVEIDIARQVAKRRGLPFQSFTIQPYLFETFPTVLASVEGFQDITQCRQAFVTKPLSANTDFLIAAHWGDVWLNDIGWHEWNGRAHEVLQGASNLNSSPIDFVYNKMVKNGNDWLQEHVCGPRLGRERPAQIAREMIEKTFENLTEIEDVDFRIKAYKTEQWSFRWTLASIRMFQSATFPRLPFYDTRLTDFLSTVPTDHVKGRRLQIEYLKFFSPDLANIIWQEFDANLFRYKYFNTWLVPKRVIKKAWRMVSRKHVIQRNWEVQFLSMEGRQGLAHWLLRPGLVLHELVSPYQIGNLLNDFFASPFERGRGYTVSMLLTFSTWLETYGK